MSIECNWNTRFCDINADYVFAAIRLDPPGFACEDLHITWHFDAVGREWSYPSTTPPSQVIPRRRAPQVLLY